LISFKSDLKFIDSPCRAPTLQGIFVLY